MWSPLDCRRVDSGDGVINYPSDDRTHRLSLAIAVVLFLTYACLLGFELVTHKQLYIGDLQDDGEDREEAHRWSVSKSLFVLVVATSLVALMSEFLVGAVEAARATLGLTEIFVGVIVIAVIGNAPSTQRR
jgi:Ca2+:H+ antiporter